jgi:hypothetical protein
MHEVVSPLAGWESFYVIVGSSAGALTGLQFVVMTLIAENMPSRGRRGETISAFGTPNVVHFCASLLVASILSVPWSALHPAGIAVTGCGVLGAIYTIVVTRRAVRQGEYRPVLEDWIWHCVLPWIAYVALLLAGVALGKGFVEALFVIGGAALLLVFIGIHNAWDTVTYVTVGRAIEQPAAATGAGGATTTRAGAEAETGEAPGDRVP